MPEKKVKISEEEYKELIKKHRPKPKLVWNCSKAFLVGGFICVIGEAMQRIYMTQIGLDTKTSSSLTVATLIFISCMLTGFGVYDRLGQWAGAGSAVPVTGFANSVASAALEHQSEGYVLGVGAKMFKLAGSVIVFGVVSAFFVGIIWSIVHLYL